MSKSSILVLACAICIATPWAALAGETVPFVGCPTSGAGYDEKDLPTGDPMPVHAPASLAQKLAWYEDAGGTGVLAPRGWSCSGIYGSGGNFLRIRNPEAGSREEVSASNANSLFSGRYEVAAFLYRFFPRKNKQFINQSIEDWTAITGNRHSAENSIKQKRNATDKISYMGGYGIKFTTPAHTTGIGTGLGGPSPYSTRGIVCYTDTADGPEVATVTVALPKQMRSLTDAILAEWNSCGG